MVPKVASNQKQSMPIKRGLIMALIVLVMGTYVLTDHKPTPLKDITKIIFTSDMTTPFCRAVPNSSHTDSVHNRELSSYRD